MIDAKQAVQIAEHNAQLSARSGANLVKQIAGLGDLRSGSISDTSGPLRQTQLSLPPARSTLRE